MNVTPLPLEHAHPSEVRRAVWAHAHEAHVLMLGADAGHDFARRQIDTAARQSAHREAEQRSRLAHHHASVALALAAVASFDRPPGQ